MIVSPKGSHNRLLVPPPALLNVSRVSSLKILGVTLQDNLTMADHVSTVVSKGAQSLFALKTIKNHGLPPAALHAVCRALLVSRLTYALPAWSGFTSEADMHRLQSVLDKARRWGLTGGKTLPDLIELSSQADTTLFNSVISNSFHVLHQYLPPSNIHSHNLRRRPHNFSLPKSSTLRARNFLHRMLYKDAY